MICSKYLNIFLSLQTSIKLQSMVNVMKGILVECDPAMKQFLLHLDENNELGKKFVLQDLDETHLFISADSLDLLVEKIDGLMDKISFPVTQV